MKTYLLSLLLSVPSFASELTVYVIPSQGIDWTSPQALLLSTAKSYFSRHSLGFAWIELNCKGITHLSAVNADSPEYFSELVWKGSGLGIFYHSFAAKMVPKDEINFIKETALKEGQLRFVRFGLNEGQCKRAETYLNQFEKNNVARNFGLAHRPRYAEGANPVSYAVSSIDVLNLVDQEMKEAWLENLNIPLQFAGHPLKDESVSIFSLLNRSSWASDQEKFQILAFWNPDRMTKWINQKVAKKISKDYSIVRVDTARGVYFEKSHYPVPEGPIWQQQLDPNDKSKTMIPENPKRLPRRDSQE
jgi:hypothetical protein